MCLPDECELPARRSVLARLGAAAAMVAVATRAKASVFRHPVQSEGVTFPTPVGDVAGYLATPSMATGPAIVVLHGEFGLPTCHRRTADELAQAGFTALAVRRFSRTPGMTSSDLWRDDQSGGRYRSETYVREELAEAAGAVDFLSRSTAPPPRIGVVGFCGGGIRAVRLAAQDSRVAAVVSFYGAPRLEARFKTASDPALDLLDVGGQVQAPVQMHYGLEDYVVKTDDINALADQIRANGATADVHAYDHAGHAFYDSTNVDSYAPAAAASARERYLEFFTRHLVA